MYGKPPLAPSLLKPLYPPANITYSKSQSIGEVLLCSLIEIQRRFWQLVKNKNRPAPTEPLWGYCIKGYRTSKVFVNQAAYPNRFAQINRKAMIMPRQTPGFLMTKCKTGLFIPIEKRCSCSFYGEQKGAPLQSPWHQHSGAVCCQHSCAHAGRVAFHELMLSSFSSVKMPQVYSQMALNSLLSSQEVKQIFFYSWLRVINLTWGLFRKLDHHDLPLIKTEVNVPTGCPLLLYSNELSTWYLMSQFRKVGNNGAKLMVPFGGPICSLKWATSFNPLHH